MNCLTAGGRYLGLMVGEESWSTVSQQKLNLHSKFSLSLTPGNNNNLTPSNSLLIAPQNIQLAQNDPENRHPVVKQF